MSRSQFITAHRGVSGIAPENTKIAFDIAAAFGFDGIELDVHLTKDRRVVVCHDETVERTSDIKGSIENLTLEQLRKGNFAAKHELKWIEPQIIMTLEELLERYSSKFKFINIELKTNVNRYEGIESFVAQIIEKYGAKDRVMVSSFNFDSLRKMHALCPEVDRGFLFENMTQLAKVNKEEIKSLCRFLHPSLEVYTANKQELDSFGLKYNMWTVHKLADHEAMKKIKSIYSQISNFMF